MTVFVYSRCTHIVATPSLYVDMITKAKENALNVTTLEYASYGGAPCSPKLAMDLQETLHVKHIIVSIIIIIIITIITRGQSP